MRTLLAFALALPLTLALGCGKDTEDSGAAADGGQDGADGADGADSADGEPVCTEPTEVGCVDALISDLSLHDDKVSNGAVTTTTDGPDFVTVVDASAGGYGNSTANAWVYVKFTEAGAEKVEIDDETALESMDWDMALRRFIVRLNGGSSGPSCVGAAALLEADYAALDSVPEGIPFALDDYYTGDCTIINDSSGLPGSPQVAMGSWWSYSSCVATTEVPHLVQLADGHVLKLVVETYYGTGQDACNSGGAGYDDSGIITLRWQMLL